jgi:hypothetical protein
MASMVGVAVLGSATNYIFDRKGDDMVDYLKSKTPIISSVVNNNSGINFSDYEVGFYVKDGKIYDAKWCGTQTIQIKEEEQKEEIKVVETQQVEIKKEEPIKNNDIINIELMAQIAAISFFVYTGYKILSVLDIYTYILDE